MKKSVTILASALLIASGSVMGGQGTPQLLRDEMNVSDDSLAQCKTVAGKAIEPVRCRQWQATLSGAIAEADRELRHKEERQRAHEAFLAEEARRAAEKAKRDEELSAQRAAEKAAEVARIAEQDAKAAEERAQAEREEARMRKVCGRDYMQPRIGMTVRRAQQCLGDYEQSGQVNRRDGVLTVYTNGSTVLHVMGGRVVAWADR